MKKWMILCGALLWGCILSAQEASGPQIYNMGFDQWSKRKGEWCLYEKDAPASHRVWDSANKGTSIIGVNCTQPETVHVAVPGEGKCAVKMRSQKIFSSFAAGNFFTGTFVKTLNLSGAEILMGTPFTGRPKALTGYIHYIPKPIDTVKEPYLDMKGKMDEGAIDVFLTDWDGPFRSNTVEKRFIREDDPAIIGRGMLIISKASNGYVRFTLPLKYLNGRTPKIVVISATASRLGGAFTGGDGSTLYLDELEFTY